MVYLKYTVHCYLLPNEKRRTEKNSLQLNQKLSLRQQSLQLNQLLSLVDKYMSHGLQEILMKKKHFS